MALATDIARLLPGELQELVWKRYYGSFVLPNMMEKVENVLCNKEYEAIQEECSVVIQILVENMASLYESSEVAFNVSLDFAYDRVFECNSPDLDKVALLNVIKENIHNPHLLAISIENTGMVEALGCSKYTQVYLLMETLQDVYYILMPQQDM